MKLIDIWCWFLTSSFALSYFATRWCKLLGWCAHRRAATQATLYFLQVQKYLLSVDSTLCLKTRPTFVLV